MDIFIPTYGRERQETSDALVRAGIPHALVVQHREGLRHAPNAFRNVFILPPNITTIAPTRQFIMEHAGDSTQMVMLDDDLVFFKRRTDDPTKLRDITAEELKEMFVEIERHLITHAHVGIAAREGANRNIDEFADNTRIMRVLGYDREVIMRNNIRFDEMEVMEDFHVALSLLKRGYANRVLNFYANNQGGSGSAGGCSHFRTMELHAANAKKLAELHPQFVTVVEKTTKGSFGGGTRKDVRIQWKQAYEYGKRAVG